MRVLEYFRDCPFVRLPVLYFSHRPQDRKKVNDASGPLLSKPPPFPSNAETKHAVEFQG